MVWYGKILGYEGISRVYGPDFMLRICSESVQNGIRHFFYGGREGVAEKLRDELIKKFTGLEVV